MCLKTSFKLIDSLTVQWKGYLFQSSEKFQSSERTQTTFAQIYAFVSAKTSFFWWKSGPALKGKVSLLSLPIFFKS